MDSEYQREVEGIERKIARLMAQKRAAYARYIERCRLNKAETQAKKKEKPPKFVYVPPTRDEYIAWGIEHGQILAGMNPATAEELGAYYDRNNIGEKKP